MNFNERKGKFFTNTNKELNDIIKCINLSRFDLNKLKELPHKYAQKLIEYKEFTDMGNERIEKLKQGLEKRIESLMQMEKYLAHNYLHM